MAWPVVDRITPVADGRAGPVLEEAVREKIRSFFPRYETRRAVLLPALHVVQDALGHVSHRAMLEVAELLEIRPSAVADTVSFYTHFRTRPKGRKVITVCRSISCQLMGGDDVLEMLKRRLDIDEHGTTPDGAYNLVTEECLAGCDYAPCMLVNEKLHRCVRPEDVGGILADPENDRVEMPRSDLYDAPGKTDEGQAEKKQRRYTVGWTTKGGYEPVLLRNVGAEDSVSLGTYTGRGGYRAIRKALQSSPEEVVDLVKESDLRGRGGAGFPAGIKWGFLPRERTVTYLCVNADESEPSTFSNRVLIEHDPHQLLEGVLVAGYATRTTTAYIYMRGEFHEPFHVLQNALDEAYAAGLFGKNILGSGFSMECYIHRGAGSYVCGEETGLIESLEGKRGWPRIKPPFPAVSGLFGRPTVVNNVETLACLPHILERGPEWFKSIGPAGSSGPKLFCVSGPVNRPGCFEAPMGVTVRELVFSEEFAGGVRNGKNVKAVVPGGISMGFLTADELDMPMDFDNPRKYGLLGLGTAAITVIDRDADLRQVLRNVTRFFASESCGQCTQCREGTGWMYKMASRIAGGRGRRIDLDLIEENTRSMGMMTGMSICGLSDGAAFALRTLVQKFRGELEAGVLEEMPERVEAVLTG